MDVKDSRASEILIEAHGKTYLTIQSAAMRLATLAYEDSVPGVGVSDGRETERQAILQALEAEAVKQGALNPRAAVARAFLIVSEIEDIGPKHEWNLDDTCQTQGMTTTPRLSAKCELSFGVRATNNEYFGTTEEPARVQAGKLVPGVRMAGDVFRVGWSVILQKVEPQEDGTVWVTAYNSSEGTDYPQRIFRNERMVETWGKL